MDASRFDAATQRFSTHVSRRSLGALAALGIGAGLIAEDAGARKKVKNKCKGGCPSCRVCKKQGKKKKCVMAPNGTSCDGGTCQGGACAPATCKPGTCASLGKTCGPVNDGCGGTLACGTCGMGTTPTCGNGTCTICANACLSTCPYCMSRPDGSSICGTSTLTNCNEFCTQDGDCPADRPFCLAVATERATNYSYSEPVACGKNVPGICAKIFPC